MINKISVKQQYMLSEKQVKYSQQTSQTHDSSTLEFFVNHQKLLPYALSSKITCMWGRIFFSQLKSLNKQQYKYRNNFAILLAKKMPKHVQSQVIKMIKYYQEHMEDQLHKIHQLVEQNHKLKAQVQSYEDKQNLPIQVNNQTVKQQRISELQDCVIQKNKQINTLNKQITDLHIKVKKYKKRVYELQAKSPIKSVVSQFM